ncbi:MAG: putative hydro-lyase [Clostridia bacterium]|nr:putative hydro-lyase [Clostridia bacterium]
MQTVYERIWNVLEIDPGHRGLTHDLPRPDLAELGRSLLGAGEVFILSGFPVQRAGGTGETDGPVGAVNIARGLAAIGKKAAIVTDEASCAAILAACEIAAPDTDVYCVPKRGAAAYCYQLFKRHRPTHIIAIERPGKAADGHYHNARGEIIDELLSDTDLLLYAQGVTTVGIGDGGNELGMGALRSIVESRVDNGKEICAEAAADFTLTAGVSNWWGWGICAVLSAITGRDLLPTEKQEEKLLRTIVAQGCVDGITGAAELTVDHLSKEENFAVLRALRQALALPDFSIMEPRTARRIFRRDALVRPTAGMCAGYAQCNLIVLPSALAADFREFARRNPFSCPVLEESEKGSRRLKAIASDVDLARDFPKYRVWRDGVMEDEPLDVEEWWNDDLTAFLIGCSFSFEDALLQAGVPVRHIEEGKNVPMYRTSLDCVPYGAFSGKMVVSMRPMTPELAKKAREITARMPRVHGVPVHMGDPRAIGVYDLQHPDFGEMVTVREGEIPVFWPCGVTPQSVVMNVRPPFAITHAPGHMLIADVKNIDLMD